MTTELKTQVKKKFRNPTMHSMKQFHHFHLHNLCTLLMSKAQKWLDTWNVTAVTPVQDTSVVAFEALTDPHFVNLPQTLRWDLIHSYFQYVVIPLV